MVLPDLDTNKSNFDIILPISNGCQFIAMKFQTHDENLISYLDYFKNDNNTYFSFKLKSEKLRLDNQNPSTIDGGTVLSEPLLDCFHLDTTTGDNQNKCEKAKALQDYITKNDKDIVVAELDTILSEAATDLANSAAAMAAFKARQAVAYSASANLAAAASRIEDTDYAQESANLAKSSILNQSAMAMVAQANKANATFLTIINQ